MKNAILAGLLGVLMFTTVFVVYDCITPPASAEEVMVEGEEYGGPFRKFFQKRKQQRKRGEEMNQQ